MDRTRRHPDAGFTLIELLVSVSVVALLVCFLLPVLGASREAAKGVVCSVNLGQLMRSWESVMFESGGDCRIRVVTIPSPYEPWYDQLKAVLPTSDNYVTGIDPGRIDRQLVCPTIESVFNRPGYSNVVTGYAINSRRRPDQPYDDNTDFKWDTVRHPSAYPWFADPWVRVTGNPRTIPRHYFGAVPAGNWGLGFYHGNSTGRAAYVDGHVAETTPDLIVGPVDALGTPRRLLDLAWPTD